MEFSLQHNRSILNRWSIQESSQQYSVTSAILSAGIDASNMLCLLRSGAFRNWCRAQIETGISRNLRDAMDMAGKVTLALKAMSVGISEDFWSRDANARKERNSQSHWRILGWMARSSNNCLGLGGRVTGLLTSIVSAIFWLADVSRENLIKAMQGSALSPTSKLNATITPWSTCSWLGKYVRWIHFENSTINWWMKNVMASSASC